MISCGRVGRFRILIFIFVSVICLYFYQHKGNNSSKTKIPDKLKKLQLTEQEQIRRKTHINKLCNQLGYNVSINNISTVLLDHLIVDDDHKLIYCYVPKVACTNWKRILLALRNGSKKNLLTITGNETHSYEFLTLQMYSKEEILKRLNGYLKFIFVRHPYERLLSAYRNKFEKIYSTYFWNRFGRKIIKRYRQNPEKTSLDKGHDVTFQEFLNYVGDLDLTNNRISFNEHWRPMFDLCFPCSIKYDIIGKYRTLEDDADYTLWQAGLSDIVFPQREASYRFQRSSDLMSTYYRNISQDTIEKLKQIYKYDFALFEYNDFI